MLRHRTTHLAPDGRRVRRTTAARRAAFLVSVVGVLAVGALAGCSSSDGGGGATPPPTGPPAPPPETILALGQRLFDRETFGGNGRTCVTCHMTETGTLTLDAVAARLAAAPGDPLFLHDGLDGGAVGTSRIVQHATIRVELQLPPYVTLENDPTRRTIIVNRGVPSTMNAPALDGVGLAAFMHDLRNNDLQEQALDAVHGHAKGTVEPTREQLDAIAAFEKTDDRFFSSAALRAHGRGGPQVELPAGSTESERRGRLFFLDVAVAGTKQGMCGQCHSGPNLNEISALGNREVGFPVGAKFATALVSETNANLDPVLTFRVDNGSGDVRLVSLPDPGILLTERGRSRHLSLFVSATAHPVLLAGLFKTPSLWGIGRTPPYFHDNSAKSLRAVVDHYADRLFKQITFGGAFVTLSEQDRQDIVAFLTLL